jgi:NAD(P)-dependent dehydrogenase (short-subunit alcohol dehydrogenase family)
VESEDRVVFISGANRGIGFGLTVEMANNGCKVAAGYREENRSKELLAEAEKSSDIFPVQVDVTAEEHVKNVYEVLDKQFGLLNVLVNCAGVNINESAQVNELSWEDLARSLKVNVGGPWLTSKILYPLQGIESRTKYADKKYRNRIQERRYHRGEFTSWMGQNRHGWRGCPTGSARVCAKDISNN